ncbi:flagellar hook-basal body complex protein FliE [Roseicyclus mahoneyensis]|uniref:Flagellar hook-basal body complex protein FliE n=1 Tax=Roseicyclus mahoneyensis TaxID=164332 RepID=A0A316GK48_9RHOB|nr:flagellar hook-basal body complex protein FliE [Roseicyclus mahoneyensis]PWK59796.1 flagellar hook-basal body complex protein FliE [Roseicyclus mahoneyensis]
MDIRNTLALQAYAQSRLAAQPTPQAEGAGAAFTAAVTGFTQTLAQGEAQARAAMTTGADPHALVTALAQTELAVETAVTVRDRVVEAYQEILRMPV